MSRSGNGADIADALGPLSLERVVLAARAYRQLHLPVAVSGGRVDKARSSEAALMKAALETDFAVPVAWSEDASRTTWENAVYTARLLQPGRDRTVVLVSQAWHLPRAIWAFERVGLQALPWPAPRTVLAGRPASTTSCRASAGCATRPMRCTKSSAPPYYRLRH